MSPTWTLRIYLREGAVSDVVGEVSEAHALATVKAYQDNGIPSEVFVHSPNRIATIPRDNIAMIAYTRNPE